MIVPVVEVNHRYLHFFFLKLKRWLIVPRMKPISMIPIIIWYRRLFSSFSAVVVQKCPFLAIWGAVVVVPVVELSHSYSPFFRREKDGSVKSQIFLSWSPLSFNFVSGFLHYPRWSLEMMIILAIYCPIVIRTLREMYDMKSLYEIFHLTREKFLSSCRSHHNQIVSFIANRSSF